MEVHPLEVGLGDPLHGGAVGLTKGFTRATILAFAIIRTIMIEDKTTLSEAEASYFTERFGCRKPINVSKARAPSYFAPGTCLNAGESFFPGHAAGITGKPSTAPFTAKP